MGSCCVFRAREPLLRDSDSWFPGRRICTALGLRTGSVGVEKHLARRSRLHQRLLPLILRVASHATDIDPWVEAEMCPPAASRAGQNRDHSAPCRPSVLLARPSPSGSRGSPPRAPRSAGVPLPAPPPRAPALQPGPPRESPLAPARQALPPPRPQPPRVAPSSCASPPPPGAPSLPARAPLYTRPPQPAFLSPPRAPPSAARACCSGTSSAPPTHHLHSHGARDPS
eukprot:scaffold28956_cov69-Phaeocystis_antarctica.AAC.8